MHRMLFTKPVSVMEPIPAQNLLATWPLSGMILARIPTRCRAQSFFVPCRSLAPFHAFVSCMVGHGSQRRLSTLTLGQFEAYGRSLSYQLLSHSIASKISTLHGVDNRDHRPAQASLSNTCDDLEKKSRNLTDGCVYTLPIMLKHF